MAYVAQADLTPALLSTAELVALTNDDVEATEVDTDRLDDVIEQVQAEVDAYLGTRYVLPLTTVPRLICTCAARMVRYRLYANRPGAVEEWVEKDYNGAVALLEKVNKGDLSIGLTAADADPETSQPPGKAVRTGSVERTYGRSKLEVY